MMLLFTLTFFPGNCTSLLLPERGTGSAGLFIEPDFSSYFSGHPEKTLFPDTYHY
jgi:hypothetical protein